MCWKHLLEKVVKASGSQKAVAEQLGYSPTTISMVLSGTYPGSTAAIEEKILHIYGGKKMQDVPEGYMQNGVGHLVRIESILRRNFTCDSAITIFTKIWVNALSHLCSQVDNRIFRCLPVNFRKHHIWLCFCKISCACNGWQLSRIT